MSNHLLTPQDSLNFKSVQAAQISPDGKLIAFTVCDLFKVDTKEPKSQIWVVGSDGSNARPFSSGPRTDEQPRWSPDGQTLAFLSDRVKDGHPQIYFISRDGGEAQALTQVEGKLVDFAWSRDGKSIIFLMEDAETPEGKKRKEDKNDAIEFEQHPKFARVWMLDMKSHEARQVTQGDVHVWEFEESPDGRDFVLLVSDSPSEYEWYHSRLAHVSASVGVPETVFTPKGNKQLAMPRWSPNGKQIALVSCLWSDRGFIAGDLWVMDADGQNARNVTDGAPRDVSSFEWMDDGRLLFVGYENGDGAIGMIDASTGAYQPLWCGNAAFLDRAWQRFTRSRDGSTIAVVREDPTNPPDVWIVQMQGESLEWKQLTHLNPQAAELELGAMEKVFWKSNDGREIQGFVVKPVGYQASKKYPLIVWVHGGPAGVYAPRYYAMGTRAQLLAANGFVVLLPNPRGSVGWGTRFTESNVGDMGGMDWQDILAGVEYCIDQGLADENRLGLAGWSYGGFMTAWGIVSERTRFKAAMVGAGITNWVSFHGTSNLSVWDAIANNADPYDPSPDNPYEKFSPMNRAKNSRTPTLILHGEADPYVPVGQGYEFYRALKDNGVQVELVVYPREGHGIMEKNHQLDMQQRIVDWFKKHLMD